MTTHIGRFEIVRELGRGAQSVVYLGRDPQLEREIAIKTLHFTHPDPAQNQTLLEEARMVGKLHHPHVVQIFEAGEEGGDLFLVFEYVAGRSLAQVVMEQGTVPPIRAAMIMRQVLDAIACAHTAGIVHRDLKPSNILLDESGQARVMDFGIAARFGGENGQTTEFSGTPSYMAPEYISRRESSPKTDIFSAGLVFYELLIGEPAVGGKDIYQVMHCLANQDIVIPRDRPNGPDDRLTGILSRALAKDPEARFATAEEFRAAIDAYLDPGGAVLAPGVEAKQSTMEFLLRRMRHKSDFPALSESVSAINKVVASEKDSINQLSNTILHDFALTNKLLKIVNSAFYRRVGGGNISTVSRAVLVLGFDAVRNIAITVLLFEHLQKSPGASQLMDDFLKANLSGLLARDLGKKAGAKDGEQAFICALFHSLGRLLSQYYFPEESDAIRRLMAQKDLRENVAAAQVLGLSFEDLGSEIAKSWNFPPVLISSMHRLPPGPVKKPATAEERLRMLAAMANELTEIIANLSPEDRAKALRQVSVRFAEGVRIDAQEMQDLLKRSFDEVAEFASVVRLNMQQTQLGKQIRSWGGKAAPVEDIAPETATSAGMVASATAADVPDDTILSERHVVSATPGQTSVNDNGEVIRADAAEILAAGIQDISNTLVEDFKLNDVLRIILETMYRAMGFRRVLLCVRDLKSNQMAGRFGFGPDANEVLKNFRFPLVGKPDVFLAAMDKGVDILISDIQDEHIRGRIPDWFRKAASAQTFVLFPLRIKNQPVGLIYADRERAGEIVISDKDLSLLRTLRNQAIMAIKQTS